MRKSAADNILDFLKNNSSSVFPAAQLQRMEFRNKDNTLSSPKAISRRLQELAEGEHAVLDVTYPDGKNAYYQLKQEHRKVIYRYEPTPDGSMREIREYA